MSPRALKILYHLGMTNLSREEIDQYEVIYHKISDRYPIPAAWPWWAFSLFMLVVGLVAGTILILK
jgi:hypothetical protein